MMSTSCKRHVMIPAIQVIRQHLVSLSGLAVPANQGRPANVQQSSILCSRIITNINLNLCNTV